MNHNSLLVKNMVCQRCILAVENILEAASIPFTSVKLGEIQLPQPIDKDQKARLSKSLQHIGFELMDNQKTIIIEKIKQLVIQRARNENDGVDDHFKLSGFLTANLHLEYTYLSALFSAVEGRTIENYFIEQRIERVKELLVYDEMSLSQIALAMGYSSTAYLSNQFKKVTGLNPSTFKETQVNRRRSLSNI